ncbi:MAG: response regulator, partial [Planctomycetota bacterium]
MAEEVPQSQSNGEGVEDETAAAVLAFLQVLGRIIRLYKLYPPTHRFVKEGGEEALRIYSEAMAKIPSVTVGRAEGSLLINDQPCTKIPPQVQDLVNLLREKRVDTLELKPGAQPEEILSFARLIALRDDQPPPEDLAFKSFESLPHFQVNEVAYKKVSASQEIVEKGSRSRGEAEERALVETLLRDTTGKRVEDTLIEKLVETNPAGLGRAIHHASLREEERFESGEGISRRPGRPDSLALIMLERAATKIIQGGGGAEEVLDKLGVILGALPQDYLQDLAGGAKVAEAPLRILQRFGPTCRGELLATTLKQNLPMPNLAAKVQDLLAEKEDPVFLFERAAISLCLAGLSFTDASPFLLDLMELDRYRRKADIEAIGAWEVAKVPETQESPLVLVADSPVYQQFFSSILENTPYRTAFYESGTEALEAILRDDPSLVILDLKLPGTHGLDLIRRLKRKNCTPPLLVVTGQSSLAHEFEVKTYPRHKFLKKPPNREAVVHAIQELQGLEDVLDGEDKPEETPLLSPEMLKYLQEGSLKDTVRLRGFELGVNVHYGPGTEAVLVDAFHLHGGRRGVVIAGCSEADADAVRLLRLFQTCLRV